MPAVPKLADVLRSPRQIEIRGRADSKPTAHPVGKDAVTRKIEKQIRAVDIGVLDCAENTGRITCLLQQVSFDQGADDKLVEQPTHDERDTGIQVLPKFLRGTALP